MLPPADLADPGAGPLFEECVQQVLSSAEATFDAQLRGIVERAPGHARSGSSQRAIVAETPPTPAFQPEESYIVPERRLDLSTALAWYSFRLPPRFDERPYGVTLPLKPSLEHTPEKEAVVEPAPLLEIEPSRSHEHEGEK